MELAQFLQWRHCGAAPILTWGEAPGSGGYPMYLGGMMNPTEGAKYMFKGGIAELKAYDHPRTANEITQAAGVGPRGVTR